MKKKRFEWYKCLNMKTLLQLISIFGFDNKSWTISIRPERAACISGVQLNIHIIHQKLLKIWILWKNKFWISWMFLIKMSLQLISMPGCDIKSLTISEWPLADAIINGVVSNFQIEFQKWSK